MPRLPAGGGASSPGAVSHSDWSAGETLDSPVQPSLAEGAAERTRRSRPLDCGDPCRAVTMTTAELHMLCYAAAHYRVLVLVLTLFG